MIKEIAIGYLSKRQKVTVVGHVQEHRVVRQTLLEDDCFYKFSYVRNGDGTEIKCFARVPGHPFTVWDLEGGFCTFPQMLRPLFEESGIIGGEVLPTMTPVIISFDLVGLHLDEPTLDINLVSMPRAIGEQPHDWNV